MRISHVDTGRNGRVFIGGFQPKKRRHGICADSSLLTLLGDPVYVSGLIGYRGKAILLYLGRKSSYGSFLRFLYSVPLP